MFIRALFIEGIVGVHQQIYAIRKNENFPFAATRAYLEVITLNEVSQKEKDKYYMVSLICGI